MRQKISLFLLKIAFDLTDFSRYSEVFELYRNFIKASKPDWFEQETGGEQPAPLSEIETGRTFTHEPGKGKSASYPLSLTVKGVEELNKVFVNHPEIQAVSSMDHHKKSLLYSIGHTVGPIANFSELMVMEPKYSGISNDLADLFNSLYKVWGGFTHMNEGSLYARFKGHNHNSTLKSLDKMLENSIDILSKVSKTIQK